MKKYYSKRVQEYEKIYYRNDPVRQKELKEIEKKINEVFWKREVLEVACGTGYWTERLSRSAKSIVATDIVEEMIEIAKAKKYSCPVTFQIEDAYDLSYKVGIFTGGLANFWFSHVSKEKIGSFLKEFHRVLSPGSTVFMADNVYIEGIGGELVKKDGKDDTYKKRVLEDGSEYLVLKNYYTIEQLILIFKKYISGFSEKNIFFGKCFWWLSYEISLTR